MTNYLVKKHLGYTGMLFTRPNKLIDNFLKEPSVWYGFIPFIIYIIFLTFSTLLTPFGQPSLNPLPKILPIPDDQYPLYQAIFGPFIKAICMILFGLCIALFTKILRVRNVAIIPIVIFYMFVGNTLALTVCVIDLLPIYCHFEGALRFGFSLLHPFVLIATIIYTTIFVQRKLGINLWKAIVIVIPSIIISFPILGMFFR